MNKIKSKNNSVPMSVLLVEDAAPVRKRLRELIIETPGLGVAAEAATVADAKALFDAVRPGAVLLDLALIGGSGTEVLRYIRDNDGGRSVVIVMSYYLEPEAYNRCSELGADFLFSKSDEFEQAIVTLRALAEREIFATQDSTNARRCRAKLAVTNQIGIHARPATMLVRQAQSFDADIEITLNGSKANAKSILGVLTLGAVYGAKVTVTATGGDADEAIRAITQLFVRGFNESPVSGVRAYITTGLGKGETILVVGKGEDYQAMFKTIIEKRGYRIIEAHNGMKAVSLFTANAGDIRAVILDMIMPEIDGRETMSVLRRMAPALPVLIMSGDMERAPVGDDSATMFIRKPFDAAALLSSLCALLGC